MANRNFSRMQALEKEVKELSLDVAIGAAGAPTLTEGLGVTSISRVSAGLYRITLNDKWSRLMDVHVVHLAATAEDLTAQVKLETVTTTKLVEVFTKVAAVATDPANGDRLLITLKLKNSSI
jgi:hypothetical protein